MAAISGNTNGTETVPLVENIEKPVASPDPPSHPPPAPLTEPANAIKVPEISHPLMPHLAVLLTAFVALVYGSGYAVQYSANLLLEVGPIAPSRESAVGSGLAFAMFLAPCLLMVSTYRHSIQIKGGAAARAESGERKHVSPGRRAVLLLRLAGYAALLLLVLTAVVLVVAFFQWGIVRLLTPDSSAPTSWMEGLYRFIMGPIVFSAMVGLGLLLARILRLKADTGVPPYVMTAAITALGIPLLIQVYARQVVPYLSPTFGGYVLSRVQEVDDKGKAGPPQLLVIADANYAVLSDDADRAAFWSRFYQGKGSALILTRRRWDAIRTLRSVPNGFKAVTVGGIATPSSPSALKRAAPPVGQSPRR